MKLLYTVPGPAPEVETDWYGCLDDVENNYVRETYTVEILSVDVVEATTSFKPFKTFKLYGKDG